MHRHRLDKLRGGFTRKRRIRAGPAGRSARVGGRRRNAPPKRRRCPRVRDGRDGRRRGAHRRPLPRVLTRPPRRAGSRASRTAMSSEASASRTVRCAAEDVVLNCFHTDLPAATGRGGDLGAWSALPQVCGSDRGSGWSVRLKSLRHSPNHSSRYHCF